eukprot:GHRR01014680.1.p1 GENE.GHRR01014680.1~~GHRR01014680.1.p1  ORF type:complete len:145 (+),score=28.69 GHRR01014680.1:422-856(+)
MVAAGKVLIMSLIRCCLNAGYAFVTFSAASCHLQTLAATAVLLPSALCLVLRWYGPGEPKKVFVERKTHRESWKVAVFSGQHALMLAYKIKEQLCGLLAQRLVHIAWGTQMQGLDKLIVLAYCIKGFYNCACDAVAAYHRLLDK